MIGTVLYPLLYVLIGTLIFVAIAFVIGQFQYGKHRGVSREEFVRTFTDRGVPLEIPSAVYDLYKSRVINKEFSVAPANTARCRRVRTRSMMTPSSCLRN
jgi:hypothetical protein